MVVELHSVELSGVPASGSCSYLHLRTLPRKCSVNTHLEQLQGAGGGHVQEEASGYRTGLPLWCHRCLAVRVLNPLYLRSFILEGNSAFPIEGYELGKGTNMSGWCGCCLCSHPFLALPPLYFISQRGWFPLAASPGSWVNRLLAGGRLRREKAGHLPPPPRFRDILGPQLHLVHGTSSFRTDSPFLLPPVSSASQLPLPSLSVLEVLGADWPSALGLPSVLPVWFSVPPVTGVTSPSN